MAGNRLLLAAAAERPKLFTCKVRIAIAKGERIEKVQTC